MCPGPQAVLEVTATLTLTELAGQLTLMEELARDVRNLSGGKVPTWTIMRRLELVDSTTGEPIVFDPGWTLFWSDPHQFLVRDSRSGCSAELFQSRTQPPRWNTTLLRPGR